jgi:hypothetical protein
VEVALPNFVEPVETERTAPLDELLQFRRRRADHHGLHVYRIFDLTRLVGGGRQVETREPYRTGLRGGLGALDR